MSQFVAPASSSDSARALVGHLLIVRPTVVLVAQPTSYGTKDAVCVDVADVSTTTVYDQITWYNAPLVKSLRELVGELVLGRMSEGTAKPGQSPPVYLADATTDPASVEAANAFLTAHPLFAHGPASTPQALVELPESVRSQLTPEALALIAAAQVHTRP